MSDLDERPLLVVYGPPLQHNDRTVCHIRITGERSYLCDPLMVYPPPPKVLAAEGPSPLGKVCGQCGRLLNSLVEEELEP